MQIPLKISHNLLEKTLRPPSIHPIRYRDGLPKTVQLQPATADRIHNGRIVDHLKGNLFLSRPQNEIGVRCCTERIADDQQCHVISCSVVQDVIGELFDEIAVGYEELFAIELLLKETIKCCESCAKCN